MQLILLFGAVNFWLLTPDVMKISIFMGHRIAFPVHFICNNSLYLQVLACLSLGRLPLFCLHWTKMCAINCVRRGEAVVPCADGNFFFQINCIIEKSGLKFLMPGNKTNPLLDTKHSCAMFNCYLSVGLIGYLELSWGYLDDVDKL